jgi:hypothetical protein
MTLVTRPVIFAAMVARRRGVMYPLAFNTPAGPFTGLRTVATSTSALRSRRGGHSQQNQRQSAGIKSQRRLDCEALRWVSLMRREPKSGFSDFGVVAMRRNLLGLGVALKTRYAPDSPDISAREAGIVSLLSYRVQADLGRRMNAPPSGPGTMIKKLAQADCEQEVTENCVVQAGQQ